MWRVAGGHGADTLTEHVHQSAPWRSVVVDQSTGRCDLPSGDAAGSPARAASPGWFASWSRNRALFVSNLLHDTASVTRCASRRKCADIWCRPRSCRHRQWRAQFHVVAPTGRLRELLEEIEGSPTRDRPYRADWLSENRARGWRNGVKPESPPPLRRQTKRPFSTWSPGAARSCRDRSVTTMAVYWPVRNPLGRSSR